MKHIPLSFDVNLRLDGFLVDLDSLFAALTKLQDRRDARGLRYALVTVLVFLLPAKLIWTVKGNQGQLKRDIEILSSSQNPSTAPAPGRPAMWLPVWRVTS